jgi:hypothetical protein
LSVRLGTQALLARADTVESRRACADVLQILAFDAYLEDAAVADAAADAAAALGGSTVRLGGGTLFRGLERALGWRRAKALKRLAYRLGYDRVVDARRARTAGQVSS